MTSQKSSVNPRFYTFRTTLASNFLLPLLNALVLSFFIPVMNFIFIKNFDRNVASMEQEGAVSTLKEAYKYLLITDSEIYGMFSIVATVGCSVLLGVMMFRFIASKKTVNVYYSLGITRQSLFVSKYLAGILMLVVAVAVPLMINVILNISYLGSSWQLWSATAYYFWSFSILACFAFTVTAAVFSCVGTVAEGCFFPFAILGAPMIVLYCLQYLMQTLFGNPYGHYFMDHSSVDLPTAFKAFNPLLFLYDGIGGMSALDATGKFVPQGLYGSSAGVVWSKPDFLPLILWTAAVAAVMFLGMYLFKKRKAEICGFLGANPVMNFLVTFLLGFLGFGLAIHFTAEKLPMALAILIGLVVYAVIYAIVDMALIHNGKEFLRGLVKLPVHLGIALVIGVVFATGLFGFSTRVPELSKVKSAAITVPSDTFLGVGGSGSSSGSDFSWGALGDMLDGFTAEADVNFVRQLHEQIVEAGDQALTAGQAGVAREDQVTWGTIQVVYELKNGKQLMRHYNNVPVKVVNQLLNVEDTVAGKEQLRNLLTVPPPKTDFYENWMPRMIQEEGDILLLSPYMEKESPVTLSVQQRKELLQCVADDMAAQKAAQRYFPGKQLAGLIQIHDSERPINYYGAENASRTPVTSSHEGYTIYLTEDMQKTIRFLQANGLYDSIGKPAKVEHVEIIRAKEAEAYRQELSYESLFFIGRWVSEKSFEEKQKRDAKAAENDAYAYYGQDRNASFNNAVKLENAQQAQEVVSRSYISYFYGVDGYFVRAKLADGQGYTTMFLPESAAPQYVKDAVK